MFNNILVMYCILNVLTYQLVLISLPLSLNIIIFPLYITIYFFSNRNVEIIMYSKTVFLMVLICIYILFSIVYGYNLIEALEKIITFEVTMIFIFIILYKKIDESYINFFLKYIFYLASFYIVLSFLMFDSLLDYKGDFDGFIKMTHNISFLLSIYFIIIVSFLKKQESFFYTIIGIPILLIDLYLIYASYGRIGFAVIGIYILTICIFYYIKFDFYIKIMYLIISTLFLIYLYFKYFSSILENDYLLYILERGLTGRDEITNILVDFFMNNIFVIFIGFGIGSLDSLGTGLMPYAVHDTNNIVGTLFELGIIGLALFLSFFGTYIYQVYKIVKYDIKMDYLLFIPMPMIFNISETTWINVTTFESIISYVFIAYTFKRYHIIRNNKNEN